MTRIEERRSGVVLVSDCCKLPFARILEGQLVISAPHGKPAHNLKLTANDLRQLANLLDWTSGVRPPAEKW